MWLQLQSQLSVLHSTWHMKQQCVGLVPRMSTQISLISMWCKQLTTFSGPSRVQELQNSDFTMGFHVQNVADQICTHSIIDSIRKSDCKRRTMASERHFLWHDKQSSVPPSVWGVVRWTHIEKVRIINDLRYSQQICHSEFCLFNTNVKVV